MFVCFMIVYFLFIHVCLYSFLCLFFYILLLLQKFALMESSFEQSLKILGDSNTKI